MRSETLGFLAAMALLPVAASAQTTPRPEPTLTLEVTDDYSRKDDGPNNNEIDFKLTKQVNLRSTLFAEIDQHSRWKDTDLAFVVGGGHAFGGRKHLLLAEGHVGFSANADSIAREDYDVSAEYRFNAYVNPIAEYERQNFKSGTHVNTYTLGAKITPDPKKKTYLQPVWLHTTAQVNPIISEDGNAFGFDSSFEATPRVAVTFKGGYGHVHALARELTVVEIVQSVKQTNLEPGLALKLRNGRGLKFAYTLERKKSSYWQQGLVVTGSIAF